MVRDFQPMDPNTDRRSSAVVRILLVDDFEPWRSSVCSMLAGNAEWQVVGEATDGSEAIQKAQILRPDVILLDIGLPNLNGIEAAKRLRDVAPSAKILFLTAVNDRDLVKAAMDVGAKGYVLKIDAHSQLLSALAGILGGDDFVSSGIERGDGTDSEET